MRSYFQSRYWAILFCSFLLLSGGCEPTQKLSLEKPLKENDFPHYIDDVISDTKLTFSKSGNINALLLAGGASVAMNQGTDDNIAGYFERHEVFHNSADRGLKTLGNPGYHFAVAGAWYIMSINSDDDVNKDRAWTMLRVLSVTSLSTITLKAIRNDRTPVDNGWAWPSGHTSSSFAVASALDEFYGPKIGIPAYAAASLLGLRMMDQGDHWGSDVVFGATLGWVVGHSIAGEHKDLEIAGFKVLPYTQSNSGATVGINLYKQF